MRVREGTMVDVFESIGGVVGVRLRFELKMRVGDLSNLLI